MTAKWTSLLRDSLNNSMKENTDSISYALATHAQTPSVRFVVHRGFVNERRPKERDDAEWSSNPVNNAKGEPLVNNCMLITTDVRAPKATEISQSSSVSLAWWLLPTKHQYRITSNAWIFPPPGHELHAKFPADRLAPSSSFDWEAERKRIFRKMSPDLRASFCRPVPGSPLNEDPKTWPEKLPSDLEEQTEQERAWIKQALGNFSLIVLEPFDVDMCELGVVPNKRTKFTLADDGEWTEECVVP